MDVEKELFVWDSEKNAENQRKHGISFEVAVGIFNDDNRIEIYDRWHDDKESRIDVIGLVGDVLFVVYTERKNHIRIISARRATNEERRVYYARDL